MVVVQQDACYSRHMSVTNPLQDAMTFEGYEEASFLLMYSSLSVSKD